MTPSGTAHGTVPTAPFRRWLRAYRLALNITSHKDLAWSVGLSERLIGDIMRGKQHSVSLDSVDTAIMTGATEVAVDDVQVYWIGDLYDLDWG